MNQKLDTQQQESTMWQKLELANSNLFKICAPMHHCCEFVFLHVFTIVFIIFTENHGSLTQRFSASFCLPNAAPLSMKAVFVSLERFIRLLHTNSSLNFALLRLILKYIEAKSKNYNSEEIQKQHSSRAVLSTSTFHAAITPT